MGYRSNRRKKMKIIQVITLGHELYGAQRHVIDLCESLKSEGHEVVLMTGSTGKMDACAKTIGIETIHLSHLKRSINLYHDIAGVVELVRLFQQIKPDVVASHSSKAGILVRIAAWWLTIPNAFTVHGWSFAEGSGFFTRKIYQIIEKVIGWISCKVIVIAEADRQYALQLNVINPSKMELIYHGIKAPATINEAIRSQNSTFTMVMSARFQAQKDHITLIRALVPLKKLDWQLYFLGDGELLGEVKELAESEGLAGKIHFEGAVDNVGDYLERAHLFLLITNWEGLPISILEAMSYGLPVVATDVAGIKEEVWHQQNGFVVARKGEKEITEAIQALYESKELRVKMGAKSREIFNLRFRMDLMTKNTIELYQKIIEP